MNAIATANTVSIFDEGKKPRVDMINPDPFAEVRLSRILHNGQATDKYLIEQLDESNEWQPIPGVGTTHSENYVLVPNQRVHDLMAGVIDRVRDGVAGSNKSIEFQPLSHSPLLWNGKAYSERWFTEDLSISPKVGGRIMLGIEARNSYDNSSKVSVAFYAMSMQCANQFRSSHLFGTPFVVSHIGRDGDLMDNVEDVCRKVEGSAARFLSLAPELDRLCDARLETLDDYYKFLDKCESTTGLSINDKKLRQEIMGVGATSKVKDLVNPTAFYGARGSLWSLLNAYSAIETHEGSGFSGAGKIERFMDFCVREAREMVPAEAGSAEPETIEPAF